ncbi:unnamed protein product [Amaranthus hypochondriacus]
MSSSKLKMAAKKFLFLPCSSFRSTDVHGGERPTFQNVGPSQDEGLCSPSKSMYNGCPTISSNVLLIPKTNATQSS